MRFHTTPAGRRSNSWGWKGAKTIAERSLSFMGEQGGSLAQKSQEEARGTEDSVWASALNSKSGSRGSIPGPVLHWLWLSTGGWGSLTSYAFSQCWICSAKRPWFGSVGCFLEFFFLSSSTCLALEQSQCGLEETFFSGLYIVFSLYDVWQWVPPSYHHGWMLSVLLFNEEHLGKEATRLSSLGRRKTSGRSLSVKPNQFRGLWETCILPDPITIKVSSLPTG